MQQILIGKWRKHKDVNRQGVVTAYGSDSGSLLLINDDATGLYSYKYNGKWSEPAALTLTEADSVIVITGGILPYRVVEVSQYDLVIETFGANVDTLTSYFRRIAPAP